MSERVQLASGPLLQLGARDRVQLLDFLGSLLTAPLLHDENTRPGHHRSD
jgi:hypothetical protein